MRAGVARDFHDLELQAEMRQRDALAVGEALADFGDALVVRAVDRHLEMREQFRIAADMIGVVMGVEDGGQFEFFAAQVIQHRARVTGIDHCGAGGVAYGPDVIVAESAQRHDIVFAHVRAFPAETCFRARFWIWANGKN
jgi:hypothetical protein